jgi:AraC-like DNA-binding protein
VADLHDQRGILYPAKLPTFHREPVPDALSDVIRWFWIPRWNVTPGRTVRQNILPFPASNLVVTPDGVSLAGPTTGVSQRDLRGNGWAVGALLRPAGVGSLCPDPQSIRDAEIEFDAPDLHDAVTSAMHESDEDAGRKAATRAFAQWATARIEPPGDNGKLANTIEDIIAAHRDLVRIDQIAERINVSPRQVQRLARRYIGLPPLAIIRRYRLQEAAQRLREDPNVTIAQVATDLNYADHAHLSADFRRVLGLTAHSYQRDTAHP